MAEIEITQAEADGLIAMEKHCSEDKEWLFPQPGGRLSVELSSPDKRENFMLDVSRAQIKISKATYQNRARQAIILMRLDLDGPPHRNPDGEEVPCPHLHTYREGFGDKWPLLHPSTNIRVCMTCFPRSKPSFGNATSRNRHASKRGYSHERRIG
jgi:hypothetical protein